MVLVAVVSTGMTKIETTEIDMVEFFRMGHMVATPAPIFAVAMMGLLQILLFFLWTGPSICIVITAVLDVSVCGE